MKFDRDSLAVSPAVVGVLARPSRCSPAFLKFRKSTFGALSDSQDSPAYILHNHGAMGNIDGKGGIDLVKGTAGFDFAIAFAGGGEQTTFSSSLQLRYSQPLFTYNRTRLDLKQLELELENARLSYAVQRLKIESDVTRQYLDLYYRQRNVGMDR